MKRQPHPLSRTRGLYLWELRFHQHLHQPGDRTGCICSGVWAKHWLPCWLHVRITWAASLNPEEHKVSIFLKSIKIAIIFFHVILKSGFCALKLWICIGDFSLFFHLNPLFLPLKAARWQGGEVWSKVPLDELSIPGFHCKFDEQKLATIKQDRI